VQLANLEKAGKGDSKQANKLRKKIEEASKGGSLAQAELDLDAEIRDFTDNNRTNDIVGLGGQFSYLVVKKMALMIARGVKDFPSVAKSIKESFGNIDQKKLKELFNKALSIAGKNATETVQNLKEFNKTNAPKFDEGSEEISTRQPTSKKAPEDFVAQKLIIGTDALNSTESVAKKSADAVASYPNMRPVEGETARETNERFIKMVKENLIWLHNQVPPAVRARSKLWYDGANKMANEFSKKYNATASQVAGVMAALSPQKDWFMNVALAEYVLKVASEHKNDPFSQEMYDRAASMMTKPKKGPERPLFKPQQLAAIKKLIGTKYKDMDLSQKALFTRIHSETYTDRSYHILAPEGNRLNLARTSEGELSRYGWGSMREVKKAIACIEDGSLANISSQMGKEHKVRNFYNNIIAPNSKDGHVTIDTHAVAAALIRPLAGKSIEVKHNFGSSGADKVVGVNGTYALYAEAYRQAAAEVGVLPREMQSITWEAIRGAYPKEFKGAKNVAAINKIWNSYKNGNISLAEARQKSIDVGKKFTDKNGGGIANYSWLGQQSEFRPDDGLSPSDVNAGDTRELPGDSVPGGSAGSVPSGTGSTTSTGTANQQSGRDAGVGSDATVKGWAKTVAAAQRDKPEAAMLAAQKVVKGGIVNYAIEHAGDILHRVYQSLSQSGTDPSFGYETVKSKVDRILRNFRLEGIDTEADFWAKEKEQHDMEVASGKEGVPSWEQRKQEITEKMKQFAAEHDSLPAENDLQATVKSINVALGNLDFQAAIEGMNKLKQKLESQDSWRNYAREVGSNTEENAGNKSQSKAVLTPAGGVAQVTGDTDRLNGHQGGFETDAYHASEESFNSFDDKNPRAKVYLALGAEDGIKQFGKKVGKFTVRSQNPINILPGKDGKLSEDAVTFLKDFWRQYLKGRRDEGGRSLGQQDLISLAKDGYLFNEHDTAQGDMENFAFKSGYDAIVMLDVSSAGSPIIVTKPGNANTTRAAQTKGAVLTPEGDVANHRDADLAKRGFITQEATKMPADLAGAKLVIEQSGSTADNLNNQNFGKGRVVLDGRTIAEFDFHDYDGNRKLDHIHVQKKHRNKGLSKVIQAEIIERGKRSEENTAETYSATVKDPLDRPTAGMVSLLGEENVNDNGPDYAESARGESYAFKDPDNGEWITKTNEVNANIPNQYTPEQRKLIADIKAASKGDPATLMERVTKLLDQWERDVLGDPDKPMTKLLSINPQALSAWAYRISKLIAKTGMKFGSWAKSMAGKMTKQNMKDIWQLAKAIAKTPAAIAKHFLDSRADKLWEYYNKRKNSAEMRKLANLIFTRSGPDADAEITTTGPDGNPVTEAVRNSIPQRIKQIRTQFANKYSNLLNRFGTEFANMSEDQRKAWDKEFRRAVIGLDPLPPGEKGKAVLEFREMMQELLQYQREAGIDIGDSGAGYFPRIWSSKLIQENIQKFYQVAKEMYKKRDQRLLDKAIADINDGVDAEAARKKELDLEANRRGANRRIKPDSEYQQDARDNANDKIDALQSAHDAKDDAHYQSMASAWALRAQTGRLDEVTLNDNGINQANAPDHADPRMFTDEEASLADEFQDDDIDKTVIRYVHAAVKKSELARVFGENGKKFGKMLEQLQRDGFSEEEIKHIAKLVRQSLDVTSNKLEGFEAKFMDWANFVVVSGYLGLSYINNLFLEPVSYGIRTGSPALALEAVVRTWHQFGREILKSVNDSNFIRKHYKNRKEFARSMDMALAETLGLTHVELDRIAQDSHWDFNADMEEAGSPLAKWLTQRVLKANFMEQSERAKVATSMAIAKGHLSNVARTFNGDSFLQNVFSQTGMDVTATAAAKSMLREAGVADADHADFVAFVTSLQGMSDSDYEAAIMSNERQAIIYRQALQRTSTGMAISTDASMKTEGSDTIFGKMLMQLMNYSYAYSQLVKDRMYDSALGAFKRSTPAEQISGMDRVKYMMPMVAGGTMTVIASIATKALVASMFPSDSGDEWMEKDPMIQVLDAASYAGMFGKKFEYLSRMVIREQVPMGPIPEAAGKAVIAASSAIKKEGDSDRANYNALKSVQRTGLNPVVVGGASAFNPVAGGVANYIMRDRDYSDAILEGLTGVEKPKKK